MELLHVVGILVNIQNDLVMQRSAIHRQSRLAHAYQLEDRITTESGSDEPFDTLASAERRIAAGMVLRLNGKIEPLKCRETVEFLDRPWINLVPALFWAASGLWYIGFKVWPMIEAIARR